jgi:hypothetical protein
MEVSFDKFVGSKDVLASIQTAQQSAQNRECNPGRREYGRKKNYFSEWLFESVCILIVFDT